MDLTQDILSLSDFKRRSAALLEQMKTTQRPLILTVNGRAELVVQDAASYQRMEALAVRLEALEGIKLGLAAMEAGDEEDAEVVFEELEQKYPFLK
jgi:prevent-host-death family protein